jgi:3-methylcrotonyl-CoA carboxylase alpha subunit
MFERILIANRGEIACRVARTARRLGVATVAVYSDADAGAMHVRACDVARRIGPAPARESYLRGDAIIAAARDTGAQAIHPGYGFLSENAAFAEAVAAAGLVFVGPPPSAIRAMGSKSASKRLMADAGVPLVPGYHGDDQDDAHLLREAEAIGYPVLIKASAGGGGKGMRVVEASSEFASALASARREAKAGFGDDAMLLEKYLVEPRHIELQVFADTHGQVVHLYERDCSAQRRHQKVIEEAPAPHMTRERREAMAAAAIAAARAIGYVGAGTVEFIVDRAGTFYFMEMNTRLQVEHPVTEMITGLDLVEWQLRVAAGEPLPRSQAQVQARGHAFEARIYAEDPERGFLPATGRLAYLHAPAASPGVRVDTGVAQGDEISPYYDPMIAKLVVRGDDRAQALARLRHALAEYAIVGVTTNVAFLGRLAAHPAFANGTVDTGLIAREHAALFPPATALPWQVAALAALADALAVRERARRSAADSDDPHSPWSGLDTWWLNSTGHAIETSFTYGESTWRVRLRVAGDRFDLGIGERSVAASARASADMIDATLDGERVRARVVAQGNDRYVFQDGRSFHLRRLDPLEHADAAPDTDPSHLRAPMSGTVVAVLVRPGERVARGAPLIVLEAMKMEHTIAAPAEGVVAALRYGQGDRVEEGAEVIELDTRADDSPTAVPAAPGKLTS